jgi:hypothetical protein
MAVPLSRPTFVLACLRLREHLRVELTHHTDPPPHRWGVLGIARVQDAQVGGHHAAACRAGAVVRPLPVSQEKFSDLRRAGNFA